MGRIFKFFIGSAMGFIAITNVPDRYYTKFDDNVVKPNSYVYNSEQRSFSKFGMITYYGLMKTFNECWNMPSSS